MKFFGLIAGLWLVLLVPALAADHPLKGVALVIGESKYANGWPALANPRNDARAMDDLLGDLGFEVDRVLDGDKAKLDKAVDDFIDEAKDADVALVYYSGHGIEAGGADYLVPVDADLSTPQAAGQSLVPVADVLDRLSHAAPVTIMLLDACRTNGLPAGTLVQPPGADAPLAVADAGLAVVRGPDPVVANAAPDQLGMVIGFAASPGQSALDGDPDGNSPYAAALLKHLGAGGYSFGDLMTMVSEEVYLKTKARQLPWVNSSLRRVLTFGKPVAESDPDRAAIAQGRRQLLLSIAGTPDATRGYVETVAKSEGVPLDALYGMLKVLGVDTSDPTQLEKQLLEGARRLKEFDGAQLGSVKSDPELARLAGLADEAQAEGAMELALKYRQQATDRARELSSKRDVFEAELRQDRLDIAATFGAHAETAALNFDYATAADMFGEAYEQVAKWDDGKALYYKLQQVEVLRDFGDWKGDRSMLDASLAAAQLGLTVASRATHPAEWAQLTTNVAGAYSSIGQLTGDPSWLHRAVDTYQTVLAAWTRDTDAVDWALVENDLGATYWELANYERGTGSLEEAATAFSGALEIMTRERDALSWAKLQSNYGVVLVTLGEARNAPADYKAAEAAIRGALEVYTEAATTREWAATELNLGDVLKHLGETEAAIEATNAALRQLTADATPPAWARAQNNLGVLFHDIGLRDGDPAALKKSAEAYRAALGVFARQQGSTNWAAASANLGTALNDLALKTSDRDAAKGAVDAFTAALTVYDRDKTFDGWLGAAATRANAMLVLGLLDQDPAELVAARDEHKAVLAGFTRADNPERWDYLQQSLALAEQAVAATGH